SSPTLLRISPSASAAPEARHVYSARLHQSPAPAERHFILRRHLSGALPELFAFGLARTFEDDDEDEDDSDTANRRSLAVARPELTVRQTVLASRLPVRFRGLQAILFGL